MQIIHQSTINFLIEQFKEQQKERQKCTERYGNGTVKNSWFSVKG